MARKKLPRFVFQPHNTLVGLVGDTVTTLVSYVTILGIREGLADKICDNEVNSATTSINREEEEAQERIGIDKATCFGSLLLAPVGVSDRRSCERVAHVVDL